MPVIQGSRGAIVLVGMPGFVIGAQLLVDGELWLRVETTADLVGCSGCGNPGGRARSIHDVGAGSAGLGPADGVGLVKAPMALSRTCLRREHLVGDEC